MGAFAAKTLGSQRIAARRAFADGLHDEGADHRRGQADAHLRQAQLGIDGADGHVAAADQAQGTAKSRALHHGQGRDLQLIKVVHQLGQLARVGEVGVVVQLRRVLHPGQVRAGGEVLAAAAQQ